MNILNNLKNFYINHQIKKISYIFQIIIILTLSKTIYAETLLFTSLSPLPDEYGFYKFEITIGTDEKTELPFILKIINLPNENIILGKGNNIYKGTLKPQGDISFTLYLKPISQGTGTIKYQLITTNNNQTKNFISQYKVYQKSEITDDITINKLYLEIETKIANNPTSPTKQTPTSATGISSTISNTHQTPTNKNNYNTKAFFSKRTQYKYIQIIFSILGLLIYIALIFYKYRQKLIKQKK